MKNKEKKIKNPKDGSFMKKGAPKKEIDGGSLTNLHIPTPETYGKSQKSTKLRPVKGEKMKSTRAYKHGGHHKMYRASGGLIYEHEMVGEHPTHSMHHFNYEGMMRGEHPHHRADSETISHPHGDKTKVYAAGGVAKVRHGEATASGKPIRKGEAKVRVY